jgi:hypothetical protein
MLLYSAGRVRRGAQPTSELVTAHDPEKPETTDREITRAVIFPSSKKISKLGTFCKPRRARARRDEAGGGGGGARV